MKKTFVCVAAVLMAVSWASAADVFLIGTGNVHGAWFDSTYTGAKARASLLQLSAEVQKARSEHSEVLLVDIGGNLQGRDAAFYFNTVATNREHLLPRMAGRMHYDAMIAGSDARLGNALLKRVKKQMRRQGVVYLSGGASTVVRKGDLKIGVIDTEDPVAAQKLCTKKKLDYVIYRQGDKLAIYDGTNHLTGDVGRAARNYAYAVLDGGTPEVKKGYVSLNGRDNAMWAMFRPDYEEVKAFVNSPMGRLSEALHSRDAYPGQSDYMNFYHSLALGVPGVDISLASLLHIDGVLPAGNISYADIATLYPYDNNLVVLTMKGSEIRAFLESSYDNWIRTPDAEDASVLRMKKSKDYKTGRTKDDFAKSPGNYESAAGINYTVDVSRPYGERVNISSLADGLPFDEAASYNVAVTSYRATGAGGFFKAAGLDTQDKIKGRIISEGISFRDLLYDYLKADPEIGHERLCEPSVIGNWEFLPESAPERIVSDLEKILGK